MKEKEAFTHYFREVQPKFTRLCVRNLSREKLTIPQFAALNVLAAAGTLPMTELSGKLYISKPAVTNLVDRLEENKYLKRISEPNDRRVHLIRIEPKGEKLVREMQASILVSLLKTLEKFSAAERQTVTRFYKELSEVMDVFLILEDKKK